MAMAKAHSEEINRGREDGAEPLPVFIPVEKLLKEQGKDCVLLDPCSLASKHGSCLLISSES